MNSAPVRLGPVVPATVCDQHDAAEPKHCPEAFAPPPSPDRINEQIKTLLSQAALARFNKIFHGI